MKRFAAKCTTIQNLPPILFHVAYLVLQKLPLNCRDIYIICLRGYFTYKFERQLHFTVIEIKHFHANPLNFSFFLSQLPGINHSVPPPEPHRSGMPPPPDRPPQFEPEGESAINTIICLLPKKLTTAEYYIHCNGNMLYYI